MNGVIQEIGDQGGIVESRTKGKTLNKANFFIFDRFSWKISWGWKIIANGVKGMDSKAKMKGKKKEEEEV